MATKAQIEATEARDQLRQWIKPGDTVYTVLRHVSKSGMMRAIDVYIIENGEPSRITWQVGKACGYAYNRKHEALTVNGCGMDMGFAVVNDLGYYLFPDGFECIGDKEGKRCPASEHFNGDRDYTPHWHKSGAYAITHRWM